ncbi:carboxylesterase family protein [Streptomyces anulatus]|uniref:carboxylesterase family protein n=1 Tax=Streptomyces anulatus TaxID=1892 RepID=UPI00403D7D25
MSEQPKVRTTEGVVQGRRRQGHAVFRGIPYAQPPVGMLRFAAPAPPHRWEGTRQAVEFGPVVPLSLPIDVSPQGTDWLTLNVGTPDPGAAGLPVLVWIPVGGYLSAASSDPMFDPAALTESGVVVVTVNCRVARRVLRSSTTRRPTADSSTRSRRWSGCSATSPSSVATPAGSPWPGCPPGRARSPPC